MSEALFYIFIVSFLIQLVYFLFIFSRLIFFKQTNTEVKTRGVSVVIAAKNEKENLQRLIPILLAQNYPDFEIIIADDNSKDGTYDLINTFKDQKLRSILITETPENYNSKKYALTKAIEIADKEIILLTDADCLPSSNNWISEMQSGYDQGKEIVLGYSPYEEKTEFLNLFIRYETFYTAIQYLSFAILNQAYMGVGRNLSYKKSLFMENKGFGSLKSITGGDDDLLIGQIADTSNVTIKISKESKVYSIPKKTYKDLFLQKLRHISVGKRYKLKNKVKTGLLPISHLLLYFSLIALIFNDGHICMIMGIFILRTWLLIAIFALISRKLGETIKWFWFPVLDLIYLVYYITIGTSAVFSKKIKWT